MLNELIDVGFTNIWTTNFDNTIELNYQKRNILINKVFQDADLSNVELNKRINIFIAYPNMISEDIWNKVCKNITSYPYLEGLINKLSSNEPIESLSKTIVHILNSTQDNK